MQEIKNYRIFSIDNLPNEFLPVNFIPATSMHYNRTWISVIKYSEKRLARSAIESFSQKKQNWAHLEYGIESMIASLS